jgi:UDP-3-O-acyl-N-acetylglucosamine deacetylase
MPLLGRLRAERSGHLFHAMLMTKLLRDDAAWEVVDMPVAVYAHDN